MNDDSASSQGDSEDDGHSLDGGQEEQWGGCSVLHQGWGAFRPEALGGIAAS